MFRRFALVIGLAAMLVGLFTSLGSTQSNAAPARTAAVAALPATTVTASAEQLSTTPYTDGNFQFQVTVRVTGGATTPTGAVQYYNCWSMGCWSGGPKSAPLDATGTATFVFDASHEAALGGWHLDRNGVPNVDWSELLTYPGDATHAGSQLDFAYFYPRVPVVLTAPKVSTTSGLSTTFRLQARLTYADGTPVAGRQLSFYRGKAPVDGNTNRVVCRAVTDAQGLATCTTGQALQVYFSDGGWVLSPRTADDDQGLVALVLR